MMVYHLSVGKSVFRCEILRNLLCAKFIMGHYMQCLGNSSHHTKMGEQLSIYLLDSPFILFLSIASILEPKINLSIFLLSRGFFSTLI
jgi:hypothetical protein